jgi:leucyl aminopeptidase
MEIKLEIGALDGHKTEMLVVGIFEGQGSLSQSATALSSVVSGKISQILTDRDFTGIANSLLLLYTDCTEKAKRILLVGLGKESKFGLESIRNASGVAAKRAHELGVKQISIQLFEEGHGSISVEDTAQAIVEGVGLSLYQFTELKSDYDDSKRIETVTILLNQKRNLQPAEAGIKAGKAIVDGTSLTRDLVNWPGNFATPTFLAEQAIKISEKAGLTCQILDEKTMRKLGMGGLLGVSSGSEQSPKFIILELNANKPKLDTIVLVGKGVTFDSGGISLKPSDDMGRMRSDMAGGAAVLGAITAAAELELPLHLVALVPATENMPDGRALKPGDVLRVMNGKTVEIVNTDSEGRLVLADALCYASRYAPKIVVDIATLTGSRTVALGSAAAGLFSNDESLVRRFVEAGIKTHERVWQLPLWDDYAEELKSFAADMKHQGGKGGGACIAAAFLNKFVSYPWVHLDIAGLASTETEKPYTPRWATGLGTRLLIQFIRDWVSK